jgi:hypothetical protein
LDALEAAAVRGDAVLGSAAADPAAVAAAAGGSSAAGVVTAGKANQPLMLYYVFNYLLHRRCWKTAAIIAQEMLAVSSSSSSTATAAVGAAGAATAMECSASAGQDDHPMPDAADAAAAEAVTAAAGAAAAEGVVPSSSAATAAAAAAGAFSEADVQDALRRQKIYDAVCAGHIADALAIVKAQYGQAVLQQNPHLHFKLRVQQFVELVREACSGSPKQPQQPQQQSSNGAGAGACSPGYKAALAYGRAELRPWSKCDQDEELLADAMTLLAYDDPAASPCGHLLRESYRADLAEDLNGALLKVRRLDCCWVAAVISRPALCQLVDDDTHTGSKTEQAVWLGEVGVCTSCAHLPMICSAAGRVPGSAG